MRAEILNVSNGSLQANKFTMVRGDTLEITLRVIKDDETPLTIDRYEIATHDVLNGRVPEGTTNHRLSIEFLAALKDGGEIRLIYRTTQSALQIEYGPTDELKVIFDQDTTKHLPAPLSLNFDMQLTEFVDVRKRRTATVYQGILQIDKDFTRQY
jgi:hypothetical protein